MEDDPRTKPLREWNRLARENAENAIVSSMLEATAKSSDPIEQSSTWLLIGTAAIASFLITNSEKLLPLISSKGFLVCGAFLCLSCIFGLLSKIYALRCKIGIEVGTAIRKTFSEHLNAYKIDEDKIKQGADFWGISLETGIRMDRILEEFYKPQPKYAVWLAKKLLKKHKNNPQVGHMPLITALNKQGILAFFQAILFLGFLVSGFIYASAI